MNFSGSGPTVNPETLQIFTDDFSTAQTLQTILTPASGKKIILHQVFVSTSTTNINITLEFATSSILIFKLYTAQSARALGTDCHLRGAVDEPVTLTCGTNTFISIVYHEA